MRLSLTAPALAALLIACSSTPSTVPEASATVSEGDPAPNFSKSVLGGGTFELDAELGPVIVLFLFGYACPICIDDCPDFQANVHEYYESTQPGMVKVIGADLWDGSPSQVQAFRSQTGATFPLLLDGSQSAGGNLSTLYGPFDNYVVIDGSGTVVYHAADTYSHGNRYHLDEIRAAVDEALAAVAVGTGVPSVAPELSLSSAPTPFRTFTFVELDNTSGSAQRANVSVYDASGRFVARLLDGDLPAGTTSLRWDARAPGGRAAAPGVYFIRARTPAGAALQRVVLIR